MADDARLSRIQTLWTLVCQAHDGPAEAVSAAQQQLLDCYGGAVRRYLLGALRDPDAADDLFQEFAYRFLHGDLRRADPTGRFRDFLKGVLFHLVADHHQRGRRRLVQLPADQPEPAVDPPSLADSDRAFLASWRDDLLARSWAALEESERATSQPFHTVLRFRAEHPDLSSSAMAEQLSTHLARPLTAASVRQTLHRARERFADLLLDAAAQSLVSPTADQLEQELLDLGLFEYCRPALDRRRLEEA